MTNEDYIKLFRVLALFFEDEAGLKLIEKLCSNILGILLRAIAVQTVLLIIIIFIVFL